MGRDLHDSFNLGNNTSHRLHSREESEILSSISVDSSMNYSSLSLIQIPPLAVALSFLEIAICVLSMVSSIIAMWKITTFPLIPCLFR